MVGRALVQCLLAVAAIFSLLSVPASAAPAPLSIRTHIFYYSWYGSAPVSGSYVHWADGNHHPPDDISSDYYPALGAYDSSDFAGAVTEQMREIAEAGVWA